MKANIVVLSGDGIGPEVTAEAVRVLRNIAGKFRHMFILEEHLIGGCSIEQSGTALTDETLEASRAADAVLLGAVGGPKWDDPDAKVRPEQGLLRLRKELGLFANLRPVKTLPVLADASPLRPEKLQGVDLLVVRELTGGAYFGRPQGRENVNGGIRAVDTIEYHEYEIKRILDLGFRLARGRRKKITSVDKANVLETSRLWRQTATSLSKLYGDVQIEHMLVDTASMKLITSPASFDVIVTENMFGDILTDEASVLAGSMGLLPSASIGERRSGVYEPIHGSAPDIAGKGIANPIGAILSAAMLLRHSLGLELEAKTIENAVERAITKEQTTSDLGGTLATSEMTDRVIANILSA